MKNLEFEEITLFGYKVRIYEKKVEIYNEENIPFYDFKGTSDRLVQYMVDEMFIPNNKIKVEVVTFDKDEK
jgi:hypothetical protein